MRVKELYILLPSLGKPYLNVFKAKCKSQPSASWYTSQYLVEYSLRVLSFIFLMFVKAFRPFTTLLLVINLAVNCSASSLKLSIYHGGNWVNHLRATSPRLVGNIRHITAVSYDLLVVPHMVGWVSFSVIYIKL